MPHFRPDSSHTRIALNLRLPASVEQATRTFSSLLRMALAASFGTIGLASYGVRTRLLFLWFTPIIGLGIAAATVVGQNIGAGLTERAEHASRVAPWLLFAVLTLVGLAHLPFVPLITSALAPGEADVIENALRFAYVYSPFLGLSAVTNAGRSRPPSGRRGRIGSRIPSRSTSLLLKMGGGTERRRST